jgi:hypothetical protein
MNRAAAPRWALVLLLWSLPLALFRWDWGAGRMRALVLLVMAGALGLAVRAGRPLRPPPPRSLRALCAALLLAQLAVGLESVVWTARHGDIRLDQGQNGYRAVQTLLRGENPYGLGAVLDLVAYRAREPMRRRAGFAPVPRVLVERYWRTLDPADRERVLPVRAPMSAEARREAAMLGYKYGPADLLAALPLVALFGQAGMPLLNVLCLLLLAPAVFLLLRAAGVGQAGCWLGLALVLGDAHLAWSCLHLSAMDVRVLLPLVLSLRAFIRMRPVAGGAWLGVALATKIVPAVIFLPLLVAAGSWAAAGTCLAVVVLLFGPFLLWDPAGVHDLVLWGLERTTDSTSWLHQAPPLAALAGRVVLGVAGVALAWRLARGAPAPAQRFRDLALLVLVAMLGSGMLHNNYLPWATFLIAATLMSAFLPATAVIAEPFAIDMRTAPGGHRGERHPATPDQPGSKALHRPS